MEPASISILNYCNFKLVERAHLRKLCFQVPLISLNYAVMRDIGREEKATRLAKVCHDDAETDLFRQYHL